MKKINTLRNLLFLLLIFMASESRAQDLNPEDHFKYRAIYQLTYQPNSSDTASISTETMHLYLGDKVSKFMSKGKDLKDSIKINFTGGFDQKAFQAKQERTRTEFDYVIYKNIPKKKISFHLTILRDHLKYEEELALFDWTIQPESKTIKGYQAQKATTSFAGRDYTAWFTPEIPIPDGPYKFNGLPGLILQIRDSGNHYVFEMTGFEELETPIAIVPEEEAIATTKETLLQRQREFQLDPFRALENSNTPDKRVTIEISAKDKRKMLQEAREKLERRNNPIELY